MLKLFLTAKKFDFTNTKIKSVASYTLTSYRSYTEIVKHYKSKY